MLYSIDCYCVLFPALFFSKPCSEQYGPSLFLLSSVWFWPSVVAWLVCVLLCSSLAFASDSMAQRVWVASPTTNICDIASTNTWCKVSSNGMASVLMCLAILVQCTVIGTLACLRHWSTIKKLWRTKTSGVQCSQIAKVESICRDTEQHVIATR